jgi:Zinc finger, C3HC4 type (RING finger)
VKNRFYYQAVNTLNNTADTTNAVIDIQLLTTVSLTDDCDIESCTATTTATNTVSTAVAQSTSHARVQSLTSSLAALVGRDDVQLVDEPCYICAHAVPNAVLLGCGHGGVCFVCAESLVQRKRDGVPEW